MRFIRFSLWDVWTSDVLTVSVMLRHSELPTLWYVQVATQNAMVADA